MDRDDEHSAHTDRRYASLDDSVIPDTENLKVTLERALPFVVSGMTTSSTPSLNSLFGYPIYWEAVTA